MEGDGLTWIGPYRESQECSCFWTHGVGQVGSGSRVKGCSAATGRLSTQEGRPTFFRHRVKEGWKPHETDRGCARLTAWSRTGEGGMEKLRQIAER
jgi:hypothetical protein